MVRDTGKLKIPMPRNFTPHVKTEIIKTGGATTDITSRILRGEFVLSTFRVGIGNFKVEIINTGGIYTREWLGGDTIRFYGDMENANTKQFEGRIDYPRDRITDKGQILEIEGRHIAFELTEAFINKSYTAQTIDYILKDLVDTLQAQGELAGYTYTNVDTFTDTFTISWTNKSLIECLIDLCEIGGADGYVDNDKGFHLFAENSVTNELDALADGVPGRNLLQLRDYGEDTYYEKDKITVYGKDDDGQDIMHTAGTGTRAARPIVNESLKTMDQVKEFAIAKLAEFTDVPPQAVAKGYGMPYIRPGENMWIFSPRNKVVRELKVIEIKHLTGTKVGKWLTEVKLEKEPKTTEQQLKVRAKREMELVKVINPNNLSFSYNFTFDDDTNIESHSSTETKDGYLGISSGTTGAMQSSTKAADNDITQVELKYSGENLENSTFEITVTGDFDDAETVTKDTLHTVTHTGKKLRVRVNLSGATAKVYSLAILYK